MFGSERVSIHAPRAGRDFQAHVGWLVLAVSIHAPRAGRDLRARVSARTGSRFQSTRPARGATPTISNCDAWRLFQSTRPARGATTMTRNGAAATWFQSTRPARGATAARAASRATARRFNPRAPRGARRAPGLRHFKWAWRFNPRAPRGARPCVDPFAQLVLRFQSTRPARGATCGYDGVAFCIESFNPRAPRGARRDSLSALRDHQPFQSTRPARGATEPQDLGHPQRAVSIHAPRAGRDTGIRCTASPPSSFNPRAPRGARHAGP